MTYNLQARIALQRSLRRDIAEMIVRTGLENLNVSAEVNGSEKPQGVDVSAKESSGVYTLQIRLELGTALRRDIVEMIVRGGLENLNMSAEVNGSEKPRSVEVTMKK